MSPNLTAALFSAAIAKTYPVEIPELSGTMYVKKPSAAEVFDFIKQSQIDNVDKQELVVAFVSNHIVDVDNNNALIFSDAFPLSGLPIDVFNSITTRAMESLGLAAASTAEPVRDNTLPAVDPATDTDDTSTPLHQSPSLTLVTNNTDVHQPMRPDDLNVSSVAEGTTTS